ncbi:MAG: hypothetical protein GY845_38170 [Planctomycetes bacterium]|nr:hypothetical protein [Planctomycetota bacterium]
MFLLFLVDALRHDFVTETNMPFLYRKAQEGALVSLKPTLAYEARPAFFSGLYAENANIAFRYIYNPATSPFKLSPLVNKLPLSQKYKSKIMKRLKNRSYPIYRHFSPRQIPPELMRFFDFGEKEYHWNPGYLGEKLTLFDVLRSSGRQWALNSWPSPEYGLSYGRSLDAYIDSCEKFEHLSFFYSTISDTDWAEHKYGPDSEAMAVYLRVADTTMEAIFSHAKKRFGIEPQLVAFGDHGAVTVTDVIDLESRIKELALKVGTDFVYFVDSAIVRFWFNSDRAHRIVRDVLSSEFGKYGDVLTEDDFENYHFRVDRSLRGDVFYLAKPGVLIFPNFHSRTKPERGMHGYTPDHKDESAACVIYTGKPLQLEVREEYGTVDLTPTVLRLLNLPDLGKVDGRSIVL